MFAVSREKRGRGRKGDKECWVPIYSFRIELVSSHEVADSFMVIHLDTGTITKKGVSTNKERRMEARKRE